jgi:WD40 repeat protein
MMVKFLLSGRYLNLNNSDHTYQLLTLIWFSFVRKDDQCVMLGLQTFVGHTAVVSSANFSPDGKQIVQRLTLQH